MNEAQKPQIAWKRYFKAFAPLLVIPFVSIFILEVPNFYILSKRGVQIEGTVIKVNRQGNRTFYEYSYLETNYRDDFIYHIGSSQTYPKVGDKWKVTVDPENPGRHCLGNPTNQFYDGVKATIFFIIGIIVVSFFRLLLTNPLKTPEKEFSERLED
ncbi:MAG TPA: DUF3592 domain-containing protein [Pyrinomonadaceae bacterium]|jgi:hypothetical protein